MTSTNREDQLDEQALADLARASLDDSIAHLDGSTLSQLNRARQAALQEARKPFIQRHWLPLGAAACAVFAFAIALPLLKPGAPTVETLPGVEDAYISASEEAALVDDLDLLLWLMENEDHTS